MRAGTLGIVVVIALAAEASAGPQQAKPFPVALDTVAAVDQSVDESGNFSTGVNLDTVLSIELGGGFEAFARPSVQRLPSREWNRQVWVAAVRYQRSGRLGVRVDAGLIPSPVGLANLTLRPHQIPTIFQPSSLFVPLPTPELRGPRANVLAVLYPYGVNATVSSQRWDARAAVIDTSPLRTRRIFARTNPPRFVNVVIGGGVTPVVGLRVGGSVTRGGWQRAGELPAVTADRDATVVTAEAEYSVRYTKIVAEWVRDVLETSAGDTNVTGWWIQGQQTVTPRWFAGGRVERIAAPGITPSGTLQDQHFTAFEETVGFRVTPELTLRLGHRARKGFFTTGFDNQIAVSAVWWKRWL